MIHFRHIIGPGLLALALVSCADKPSGPPSGGAPRHADSNVAIPGQNAPADDSTYKKKPRMNGRGAVSSISLEDFFVLHESGRALVIDARPAIFHQFGRIPGAINIPAKHCDGAIARREEDIKAAIAAGKTIVVYCNGILCPDARTVAMHISGFGYPASIFSGGWDAWKEAGMPVE